MEHWKTRNITLLGDAIHGMTPARGIGANIALRDADLLRGKLIAVGQGRCARCWARSRNTNWKCCRPTLGKAQPATEL
jgi:2-polyprenyl-6-methoxyphenol hydroxylase-like FAD-dependent oxidoreductase